MLLWNATAPASAQVPLPAADPTLGIGSTTSPPSQASSCATHTSMWRSAAALLTPDDGTTRPGASQVDRSNDLGTALSTKRSRTADAPQVDAKRQRLSCPVVTQEEILGEINGSQRGGVSGPIQQAMAAAVDSLRRARALLREHAAGVSPEPDQLQDSDTVYDEASVQLPPSGLHALLTAALLGAAGKPGGVAQDPGPARQAAMALCAASVLCTSSSQPSSRSVSKEPAGQSRGQETKMQNHQDVGRGQPALREADKYETRLGYVASAWTTPTHITFRFILLLNLPLSKSA